MCVLCHSKYSHMSKILVTGGTGMLGKSLANIFLNNRTDFIVGSRNSNTQTYDNKSSSIDLKNKWIRLDLTKNDQPKLNENFDTILHLASVGPKKVDGQPGDVVLTKNLLNCIDKKQTKHLIFISIVGIDRIPFSYYQTKVQCEDLIKSSGIPYTILRATQFHEFADALISKLISLPIAVVPKALKIQPIQVEAVAQELQKLTRQSPRNSTYDLGGKQILTFEQLARSLLKIQNRNKFIFNLPTIGGTMKALTNGYATCDRISAESNTWQEYLQNKYQKH